MHYSTSSVDAEAPARAPAPAPSGLALWWEPWRDRLSSPVADAVAMFLFTFAGVAAFLYVHMYSVNMIFDDQWTDVDLLKRAHDGTLTLSYLWAQHNEHRMLVPKLLVLALGATTHLNVQTEDYLCVALMCGATALIVLTHRRRSPDVPLLAYCPVVFVLLSPAVVGEALLGFNVAWFMALFALGAVLFLLDREEVSRGAFAASVAITVLASFSCLQGLFIWPALLVLMWLRRRSLTAIGIWVASAVATGVAFFVGFDFAQAGAGSSGSSHTVGDTLSFMVVEVGNVLGSEATYAEERLFGTVVLLLAAVTLFVGLRRKFSDGAPVGVALTAYGGVFLVSATVGRSQLGLGDALRYAPFVLMILVGTYLILLSWLERVIAPTDRGRPGPGGAPDVPHLLPNLGPVGQLWTPVVLFVFALVLAVCQPVVSNKNGPADSGAWHSEEMNIANVTANITRAPNYVVQSTLGGYSVPYMRQMAAFARSDHLSLFGTSLADEQASAGLAATLQTSVLRPAQDATLRGTTTLVAGVLAPGVTDVEFVVTGEGLDLVAVGTGRPTAHCFTARWNTADVIDGNYYLFSEATTATGETYTSGAIAITVANG